MSPRFSKADWSDPQRVQHMVKIYRIRYDTAFWNSLSRLVGPTPREKIVDLGCGPGLFLVDAAQRFTPKKLIGIDASDEMLSVASSFLNERVGSSMFELKRIDFDKEALPLEQNSIDLVFSGFVLHEVSSPLSHISQVFKVLREDGLYVIYDYVSGDKEAFVRLMVASGMSEETARARYPHMCRHTATEIKTLMKRNGFVNVQVLQIDGARALVRGVKPSDPLAVLGSSQSIPKRSPAPWDDRPALTCPRCGSTKIIRVLNEWALSQGVQIFECKVCGKKFYERDVDDLRPTF